MVSFKSRVGYGIGGAVFSIKEAAYSAFVLLFYTQVLGLSGTLTGIALFIAILVDCVSDPIIGAWSDRLQSRWGRRHPFMLAGILPMGLGFIGLFTVPERIVDNPWLLSAWLLFWSVWIRTTLSMFSIPHLAMSAEMTQDYRERSSVLGARLFFVFLCTVLVPAAALLTLFNQSGDIDGRFVQANYFAYGMISCVFTWAVGLTCIWSTRPYSRAESGPTRQRATGLMDFLRDFANTLHNRNFRQLLAFEVTASISYGALIALLMLANIYYWELDSRQIAILLAVPSLLGVSAAMFAINWLGSRLAKHTILQVTCGLLIIDGIWPFVGRLMGWLPENGDPLVFQALFVQMLLWMFLFILRAVATQSLVADISDEIHLEQGQRQEGALFAASNFAQKLAAATGPLYGGAVLDLIGLNRGMAPGTVPQSTLDGLAIAAIVGILIPLLFAFYFSLRVSMSEQRLKEIQAQLLKR